MTYRNQSSPMFGGILSMVFMVLTIIALFYIAQFIFKLLWIASPFIFIAALILDFKGVTNYGKWLLNLAKKSLITGVIAILLSMIGFPFVALFLLGKAMFKKKVKEAQAKYEEAEGIPKNAEYIEYEEVKDEPRMELPPLRQPKQTPKRGNEYDELFD